MIASLFLLTIVFFTVVGIHTVSVRLVELANDSGGARADAAYRRRLRDTFRASLPTDRVRWL